MADLTGASGNSSHRKPSPWVESRHPRGARPAMLAPIWRGPSGSLRSPSSQVPVLCGHSSAGTGTAGPGRQRMKSVEQSIATAPAGPRHSGQDHSPGGTWLFSAILGNWWRRDIPGYRVDRCSPRPETIWISFLIASDLCCWPRCAPVRLARRWPAAPIPSLMPPSGKFLAWVIGWNLVLELAMGAAVVAKASPGHRVRIQ